MGSCSSSKNKKIIKNNHHNVDHKTQNTAHNVNGIVTKSESEINKRKTLKLQDPDRISPLTINGGKSLFLTLSDIKKYFHIETNNQIAHGSFGIVRKAVEIESNKEYAVKMIYKSRSEEIPWEIFKYLLKNEIEICLNLDHENVIKCYKIFEDAVAVYFVFELIDGGDLYNFIQTFQNKKIPEYRVIELFIQILEALHYIHREKSIVHKDIKPENFLVFTEGSKLNVKLIDFGFAEKIESPNQKLQMEAGSLPYISPEMLNHIGYDSKSDMFSVGVVLFNMLTGRQPFYGKNEEERRNSIITKEPVIPKDVISNPKLVDLIKRLLEKEPSRRLSVEDAKMHPWIQEYKALHEQQTVKKEFVPNINNSKNLTNLIKITNIKNIVWTSLLTYFKIDVAYKIRTYLIDNLAEDLNNNNSQSIQGKYSVNYDKFLETIINLSEDNPNLTNKLQEILDNNREMCKEHIINFIELMDFFIKSRVILIKEKIWNFYIKIEENDPNRNVMFKDVLYYLKNDFNQNQIDGLICIAKEKTINSNTAISYEQFESLWLEYESTIRANYPL